MTRLESEIIQIEELADYQPTIQGIPKGEIVLFFAKLYGQFVDGRSCNGEYCVIYGPETCLPHKYPMSELWDAKIALGKAGLPLAILQVRHGHKYQEGGGFVEFENQPSFKQDQIFFRTLNDIKESTFNGKGIKDVYSAL